MNGKFFAFKYANIINNGYFQRIFEENVYIRMRFERICVYLNTSVYICIQVYTNKNKMYSLKYVCVRMNTLIYIFNHK